MFTVDVMSRTPIYEQLIDEVEKFVSLKVLKAGDPLPSVRKLSVELSVNPNTVQKAYGELFAKGIIASVPGRGNFVSENAYGIISEKGRARFGELEEFLAGLKRAGVERKEIETVVGKVYRQEESE